MIPGINLLLVAWWSLAMWLVTRLSSFVEGRLRRLDTLVQRRHHELGSHGSDGEEEIMFSAEGLSGPSTNYRAQQRLAGIYRGSTAR